MPLFKIKETDLVQPFEFRGVQDGIQALLFYPNDPRARAQYLASRLYEFGQRLAHEIGPGTTWTVTLPPSLWVSDPGKLAAEALKPAVRRPEKADPFDFSPQEVAGLVLIQAFSLQDKGEREISLTRCVDATVQIFKARKVTLGATAANVKDIWHQYRSVAHIAAALIIGCKRHGGSHWFNDPIQIVEFIRVANTMKARGEAIRHKQAAEPILVPGEGWEFVIAPCAPLARTGSKISEPGRKI